MLWPVLISGFTLGAAGSLHCVGMCGPLSMALPVHHLTPLQKFLSLFLYQCGRIITYAAMGLLFGLAGRRIYITGYQQWFSIGMGALVLASALVYFIRRRSFHLLLPGRLYGMVQSVIVRLLKSSTGPAGFVALGMANGLLPCGMVYIALATTLSLPGVSESVGFMAMFGAGTLPAMMLVAYASQVIRMEARMMLRKATPFFVMTMGLLLILRGLNLGIPFISPEFPHAPGQSVVCHP